MQKGAKENSPDIQVPNTYLLARPRAQQQEHWPCKDLPLQQDLWTRQILFRFETLNKDGPKPGPHSPMVWTTHPRLSKV